MASKLVGKSDTPIDGSYNYDYFTIDRYTANATGVCNNIRVKCSGNGFIRVAVYDVAGNRLAKKDAATAVSAGWNTIYLEAPFNVTNSVVYGLAYITSAAVMGYDTVGGSVHYYKASDYTGFTFPDPAGGGFSLATNNTGIIAGWSIETYDETGKAQVVVAAQGVLTNLTILTEEAKLQVILAVLGEYDSVLFVYDETGKLQVILAVQGSADNATFLDVGHTVVISAIEGQADLAVFLETAKTQIVLAVAGSTDNAIFLEVALEQVILAVQDSVDNAIFLESGLEQVMLAVQGRTEILVLDETAKLITILVEQGSWNNLIRLSLTRSISGGPKKYPLKIFPVKTYPVYGEKEG